MNKRPELDTENPPGQIVNPIPQAKYLRDVIRRIEEQENEFLADECEPPEQRTCIMDGGVCRGRYAYGACIGCR